MRPILFNKNEQSFDTYGLGELNVTKGTVTRERNGNYTLYAEIPVNDPAVASLEKEMKLKADAGLRTKNQTFEISRIVKDSSNIVKIYGQHISHKLEYIVLRNATAFSGTAYNALAIWKGALIGDLTFDVWSDIQTSNKGMFDISKMENARLALGGVEGSILDLYGGEYEFDNMTIRLHKQLGRTAPTVLEYGRNILSAELDETIESAYTSVLPFATYTPDKPEGDTSDSQPDPITVTIPENYIDSKYKSLYAHRRIKVVDFSSEFSTDGKKKNIPTADKLRKLTTDYMNKNAIGKPKINIKIEYADLAKTLDYADNGWIEELELCDIVPIYYPQIGLTDETAKVTTITYDFINERNESVEFGDIGTNVKSTMQSGLAGRVDDIAKAQQQFENSLPDYLLNAQGNKVWYNKPDDKEHKIGDIWFEKNGLYDRMYVWNGSQWEKRIDTEDIDKVKKEVDKQISDAQTSTNQAIAQANAKAEEALKKAGTLPDTSKLSDQIKQQILSSPDLQNKVTESINSADGNVIYNKIYSNIERSFAPLAYADYLNTRLSDTKAQVNGLNTTVESQKIEFNKLTESNKLYERILGTSETGAPDRLSRLVMSSDIFQTEVGRYVTDDNNLIVNSMSMSTNTLVGNNNPNASVSVSDGVFTIKAQGLTGYNWSGFSLPIYVKKIYHGETYTLGFKYRIREYTDSTFAFNIKNHGLNKILLDSDIGKNKPPLDEWQEFQKTFTVQEDFAFGEDANYPFYIYLAKNGWIEFKEPILVRGSNTGPYKPSQFDDAFAETKALSSQLTTKIGEVSDKTAEAKQLAYTAQSSAEQANGISQIAKEKAEDAQTKAIQVAEQAKQAKETAEATRTQVTQLAGSWSVRNLNSAGDVLGAINLNPDGSVRINEGLLSVGEKTIIKDGVIKKAMIGNGQIGTAHIGELDASQARLINVSAKNIVSDGLTANIIKGGKLSSLNGVTDFDLQTGWIEMNSHNVGIRNQFANRPLQYLVFGTGRINNKDGTYTALMSNSRKHIKMDDGAAGIQIWNTNDNTTAVNIYGDRVEFMYNANDPKSVAIDTITNDIYNLNNITASGSITASGDITASGGITTKGAIRTTREIVANNIFLSGYANYNLKVLLNDIYNNIKQLHQVKQSNANYRWSALGPIN
nr:MAG TPA: tail protein [Caudoviricetes sp.]